MSESAAHIMAGIDRILRDGHRSGWWLTVSSHILLVGVAFMIATAPGSARTLEIGPQRELKLPSSAAMIAKNGDTITIDAGQYSDCAVWTANNLTVVAQGAVTLRDKVCEDKAIFVIKGSNTTVRGITFAHARSSGKNGAGIRQEGTNLLVDGSQFTDNENGILSGENLQSRIVIRSSVFTLNGKCEPDCAHGIYIGHVQLLQVISSVFLAQNQGHHIKSRALRTEIVGNTIKDVPTGTASFSVDIPDGGSLILRNNVIEKGPQSENHVYAIRIGEESNRNPTPELIIDRNTFTNDYNGGTTFVGNQTKTPARLTGNRLTGNVVPLSGPGSVTH